MKGPLSSRGQIVPSRAIASRQFCSVVVTSIDRLSTKLDFGSNCNEHNQSRIQSKDH